jgi:hypothetical protein
MIIYITGASGVGKTYALKSISLPSYDLDDIYEEAWKHHRLVSTVQQAVKEDIQRKVEKHKNVIFVGLQGKEDLVFTPDAVILLVRKDTEQYYRQKLVRDLGLLCKYKSEYEDILKTKPLDEFRNYFWSNDVVSMKSLEDFVQHVKKINTAIHKDFPDAKEVTAKELPKVINSLVKN